MVRRLPRWSFDIAALLGLGYLVWYSGSLDGILRSEATAASAREPVVHAADAQYRLATIERRPVIERVSATGTLNPVALVSVSSQVSGQIKEIYADYNQTVRKDEPIALIDPVTFEIAVAQAEANLEIAQASVATQQAMVDRMTADLQTVRFDLAAALANTEYAAVRVADAEAEARRKEALGSAGTKADRERAQSAVLGAQAQLRSTQATQEAKSSIVTSAEAQLRSAQAQLLNLQAGVRQQQAALRQARIELERTMIRAPVNGTVTIRNIEVGQTVAVSLQAPVLFTIAQDLRQMQVNASVAEAEIGRIRVGQRFEFTVDAYPGKPFVGEVIQVRLHPQNTQNVVNYTVVARAPNAEMLLLPGMTATASIIIEETEPALVVPTAALRFRPPGESRTGATRIYVYEGGQAIPVPVEAGAADGGFTAVRGEGLRERTSVILGLSDNGRQVAPSSGGRTLGLF
jgi:HlyD family secretion protein